MKPLTTAEKDAYLQSHLRHRMTLLRTLRERRVVRKESFHGSGDVYRCVKDANLIAVRLLLDFLGLCGSRKSGVPSLEKKTRGTGAKFADDIYVEHFIGRQLTPADVPNQLHNVLAGVYCRADKELAHLTTTFDDAYNTEERLIAAATAIENLLEQYLFKPLGYPTPPID